MSVSPFLSNSIWSNNNSTASTKQVDTNSTPAERPDVGRLAAHPLPTKPLGQSNSNVPSRTGASEETGKSLDSNYASSHLGVIGAQRGSVKPRVDLSRSTSLSTSYQSFRSASADLPQPPHLQFGESSITSPSLHNGYKPSSHSPSFASSFYDHHDKDVGTPRVFLDSQHTAPASKPRPSSWIHTPTADRSFDAAPSSATHTPELALQRPTSSQGDRANSNGYPFPMATNAQAAANFRRNSTQVMSSSPIDAGDALSAQNLHMHQQTVRAASPAVTSNLHPGAASLNVPSYMSLSGGLLSPTAATMGSNGPSAMPSPVESATGRFSSQTQRSASADHAVKRLPDSELSEAPLIKDMMERLGRVEGGMKDFSRQISGISRNVSLLLERTKGLPPSSLSTANNHSAGNPDDLRSLNAQVTALANSVSHLLTVQNNSMGVNSPAGLPPSPLTGLGIGGSNGPMLTPQMGGLEHSVSPRVGAMQNGQFGNQHQPFVPQNATSPRPGAGARGWSTKSDNIGADRRWTSGTSPNLHKEGSGPSTPRMDDVSSSVQYGTGYTQPNAIVSKWEHLNLNGDLLRSILKYGLGPPNKIQQRALPFLLRGNDIIAQAPPTQERIASYVIPALQLVLNVGRESRNASQPATAVPVSSAPTKGPIALIICTTVDQATQAQRMALGLGAPLGIRVHIVAGGNADVRQEAQSLVQAWPHVVVGTPQKMSELFTYLANNSPALNSAVQMSAKEVRLVVLDEVDQLIARNLADHVSSMLRVLPPLAVAAKPVDNFGSSAFGPLDNASASHPTVDRQIALFSNTVPQDVLNFAQSIHLRESVRVLVRRDGSTTNGPLSDTPASGLPQHSRDAGLSSSHSVSADAVQTHKGLRQYYLYVAVTSANNHSQNSPVPGMFSSPASEMKLDLIADLLEDIEFGQVVIYTANAATQEAVVYKLSTKGIEALALNREMNAYTRQQTLSQFRSPTSQFSNSAGVGLRTRKALVVSDMALSSKDVHQIPLVVFYDMPRSVEEYKDRITCATAAGQQARPSVCINVVTASGGPRGDIEMLRTLECHLNCKMAELPMDPKHILNF